MKKTVLLLTLLATILSCKEAKKTDNPVYSKKEAVEKIKAIEKTDLENKLRIYIDGIIKDDVQTKLVFHDDFGTTTILSNQIKGRPKMQQRLSFVFPEYIIPSGFYIIFDTDCTIDLDKIVLNINNDRIIIQDSAFAEYFKLDSKIVHFSANDTISASESLNSRIINRYSKYK